MNEPDFDIERTESVSFENERPAETAFTDVSLETAIFAEMVSPTLYEPDAGAMNKFAASAACGTAAAIRNAAAKNILICFMRSA
jgi:hypothetical protein